MLCVLAMILSCITNCRFDKRITQFAEDKFKRDGIDLKVGSMVTKVTEKEICTKEKASGQMVSIPYGMVVWSTGIGTRPVVMDFMKQIGQVCTLFYLHYYKILEAFYLVPPTTAS